jgi:hypothetical protein
MAIQRVMTHILKSPSFRNDLLYLTDNGKNLPIPKATMSMTVPALSSPNPSLRITSFSHLRLRTHNQTIPFRSSPTKTQSFSLKPGQNFPGFSGKILGFVLERKLTVCASAGNGGVDDEAEAERQARGESTMPERFRYLTKEVPAPPVRWPWFVGKFLLSHFLSICSVGEKLWGKRRNLQLGPGLVLLNWV